MKELRTISADSLRTLCIKRNFFTMATNKEYDRFLTKWSKKKNLNTKAILEIAHEIRGYSDFAAFDGMEISDVCNAIANACDTVFTAE